MGETTRRILSAVVLVPSFMFVFYYTGMFFIQLYLAGLLVMYLGIKEFYSFANRGDDGRPFVKTGYFFSFAIYSIFYLHFLSIQKKASVPDGLLKFASYFTNYGEWILPIIFIFFISVFVNQILTRPLEGAIFSTSSTMIGALYLSLPFGFFVKIVALEHGIYYLWIIAGLTFITDAGAYFGGRWFGRHPAGLKISPKKTWEGYVTGLITSVIYTIIVTTVWESITGDKPSFNLIELIPFTIIISIISVSGDLAESAMKRDAKVKDSASAIPGHGGILDLGDALIFTIPVSFLYLFIKQILGFTI